MSNVVAQDYTATNLTPGRTYSFKVTARNIVGYGAISTAVTILAAKIPDAPVTLADVTTVTDATKIGI